MPRVLVIEDEPAIAETLVYALETESFTVEHALTGTDGIEAIARESFDLVVLDVGLPDKTGFEVCRELRAFTEVPILFLTARDSEVDRVLGLEMGGDDYVTKPFSPREVVARIRAILRRAGNPTDSSASGSAQGPLAHDPVALRILCRGTTLDLTAHEYRLVLALLESPGRVFSRTQLMEVAWEDPGTAMERTVDAHIKSVRAKLGAVDEKAPQWIVTRRGLGYCLEIPV